MSPPPPPELSALLHRLQQRLALLHTISADHAGLIHELEPDPEVLLAQATPPPTVWERLRGELPRPQVARLEEHLQGLHQRVVRLEHHLEHLELERAALHAERAALPPGPQELHTLHDAVTELTAALAHSLTRLREDARAMLEALGRELPRLARRVQVRDLEGAAAEDLQALRGMVARVLRDGRDGARLTTQALDRVADEVELLRAAQPELEEAQRELLRVLRKARVGVRPV